MAEKTFMIYHSGMNGEYIDDIVPDRVRMEIGACLSSYDVVELNKGTYHDRQTGNFYTVKRVAA